jgi:beta-N-acetylhexosaminidase
VNRTSKNIEDILGAINMPRLEITRYEEEPLYRLSINSLIERKIVGGFCIFGGTIESLPIILDELQQLAKKTGLPDLIMSCDCEWGLPMRLHSGGTEFPHFMALEQMGDQSGIRQVAQAIGTEMSALGLHWNFAPVADINSNPKNPIINIRAFSGDPDAVAECAKSFFEGLESAGIISTAKHFPGHGDTHIDSHKDLPSIERSAEEFEKIELFPFKRLVASGIPSIMTGHIAAPKLAQSLGANEQEKDMPATISPFLTRILLRERIGFEGVIITDSLEMYGLQKVVSDTAEIALRAFSAGADMLLMPTDPVSAYNGLKQGIENGRISMNMVEDSSARIEKLRIKYVIEKPQKVSVKWLDHEEIAHSVAKNSLSLTGSIPKPLAPSSVIIIASGVGSEKKQRESLSNFFSAEFPKINLFMLTSVESPERINFGSKPLVVTLHRPRGVLIEESGAGSVLQIASEIVRMLLLNKIHPIGVICLGDPYIAVEFIGTEPDFILRTYSDSKPSVRMTLQLLKENI